MNRKSWLYPLLALAALVVLLTAFLLLRSAAPPPPVSLSPTLIRGTYTIDYALEDGLPHSAPFDVDAPWVRVTELRLEGLPYAPGDTVQADLTVASTDPLTVALHAWLLAPDGTSGDVQSAICDLQSTINNHLTLTLPLSTTQAGPHRLIYTLADPADPDRIYAAGSETFDVGVAMLLGLHTDRAEYSDPTAPVTATLTLYAAEATDADVILLLDGVPVITTTLALPAGVRTVEIPLDASMLPGYHSLTARVGAAGLTATAATSFPYGTHSADLVPCPPFIPQPSAGLTQTVEVAVFNLGHFSAVSTTVQLWDGEPGSGLLLGEEVIPALDASRRAVAQFVWEIGAGAGGPHTLTAVADPENRVAEWFEGNNTASAEITLPPFALEVETEREAYAAGEPLTVTIRAVNLMATETERLTITATMEYGSLQAFRETVVRELAPRATEMVAIRWETADLIGGHYTIRVRRTDPAGTKLVAARAVRVYDPANFTAEPRSGPAPLRVTFRDLSVPLEGVVSAWQWDFGDSSPVVTQFNPVHIYTEPGIYTVTLTTTVGISTFVRMKPNYITVLPGNPPRYTVYLPLVMRHGVARAATGSGTEMPVDRPAPVEIPQRR